MNKQIFVYEFRANKDYYSSTELLTWLPKIAKKFTFQLERGEQTGYEHWQGRFSLIKRQRKTELMNILKGMGLLVPNYLEPTMSSEHKKEAFYCMKEDTRIDGPWTDKDEVTQITKQLEIFKTFQLRPMQSKILSMSQVFDMRYIDIVYDTIGNCGKSLLAEYMEYLKLAEEIPPFRLMDDIFQWVASRPIKKCYFVDMPRGMKKDKLGDFYAGIEVIKNGIAYDKRYAATKKRFDRPRIFVFTNELPNLELMSKDRWNIWRVTKDYDLVKYVDELDPYGDAATA